MTDARLEAATAIARDAGALALRHFRDIGALDIQSKGTQDLVSNADLEVETFIRARIADGFPDDGILGEEHAPKASVSGWTWVIDPIDGTANFVSGIPQWCVILALVLDGKTRIGVIYDPVSDELFHAAEGQGAYVNGTRLGVARTEGLHQGSVGVGMNGKTPSAMAPRMVAMLAEEGGIFFRNASGGLMLAYVAAGRLIGYTEPHMNAWDCMAGQLMVAEAGGRIEAQDCTDMMAHGGRVVAASPDVFDQLVRLSDAAYTA
ncbi:inositol monophosphatase family protein [Oceanibium sediminis]|uniref:inositol monophosphatase family protein n=1 Tax=Oceanibium sediminis TaxID=2026339 RepID=UPI000DD352A2|nr:inositol monophosphatase [Oceanibium sediminis]